ncbi:hypothetical protein Rleg9DRAFT_6192 [Rhizobium leguminosarum bv. trifolii WSM597]|uniref:Uncharacterized protein n=1 Tax=Rhizobium leguminosarum bv. trifolii WSM597 TaxID=754764 RepID=J0H9Z0_RHILT|nr:hypothetical protein [Rhizobium leguminosarum]EJB07188.1 hypothetical protein Rleg9DRAFT_6192 [Rhizobium leguminosarum bv. trifolii WSM597]
MSTLLTINVKNYESQTQNFYFFQQPAIYTGGGQVYSNSLFSQSLGNYDATGAILTFQVNLQYYAGIQQANTPPQIGASSGYASASRAIDLAPGSGGSGRPNDWTTATVNPLGLSAPIYGEGVQPGAFRITTPVFNSPPYYNVGSAVAVKGGIVLSNFVQANPASNTDCQPVLKYYVQTGSYTPGVLMNFSQSSVNAALCDFTGRSYTCNVSLKSDGTWTTQLQ